MRRLDLKKTLTATGLLDHGVNDSETEILEKAWHMQMYPKWCTPSHCRPCSHVWVWDAVATVSLCLREGGG